jgi:hypothetical protein
MQAINVAYPVCDVDTILLEIAGFVIQPIEVMVVEVEDDK